uniref:uS12 prolyl 3-hydroxylase n=1 Tax=Homalodisca liturata TaxID=320908 RepID=A0A1B6ISS4_9HEMI
MNPECELVHHPDLKLYQLKNVLPDGIIKDLSKQTRNLTLYLAQNDLHCFRHSEDFSVLSELPDTVRNFVKFMETTMRKKVEMLYGIKTKQQISMTTSLYGRGDFLLCHDDLWEDRQIAFVLYLSEDICEQDGGSLRFFQLDEELNPVVGNYRKQFQPAYNSMVFFEVTETSYHEVQEILRDKQRLSINGWFHKEGRKMVRVNQNENIFLRTKLFGFSHLQEDMTKSNVLSIVERKYLAKNTTKQVCKDLQNTRLVSLQGFLDSQFYNACAEELSNSKLEWHLEGPPNRRNYEVLRIEQDDNESVYIEGLSHLSALNRLINFLMSDYWLRYLDRITKKDFIVLKDDHIPPTCMVEVQRWKEGSYSVLADNDFLKTNSSVEVVFFFNADNKYFEANDSLSNSSEIYGPNFKYSGNLIVSVSNEMPTPVQHKLKMIKQTRILQSKIADRRKISKKAEKQIRTIVNDKIKRMMEYRDKNNSVKALDFMLAPTNNNMVIMIRDHRMPSMYHSYMKRQGEATEPHMRYHSLTVNYLIA